MAGRWIIRSVGAVAVKLSRLDSRHEDVPVVRRAIANRIERDDADWLRPIGVVEEDDLHSCGVGGKDTEVCSFRSYCRAERIGMADGCLLSSGIVKLNGLLMHNNHLPLHSNATRIWAGHRNPFFPPIKMPLCDCCLIAALHHGEIQERNDDGPRNADGEQRVSAGQARSGAPDSVRLFC
jgi:hypothetical protein